MPVSKGGMEYKVVVVVRDDLRMSGGKLAVQVAHAAVSCALEAKKDRAKWFREWFKEGQRKVVVKAMDLEHLLSLDSMAKKAGLPRALISDAGLTELPSGTTTCLGVGPAPDAMIDPITGSLPLM